MTARHVTPPPQEPPAPARRRRRGRNTPARRIAGSALFQRAIAALVRGLIGAVTRIGRARAERLAIALFRLVGPLTPEHRTAARNIAAAFPEKSAAERKAILAGCWRNLARVAVEFLFLKELAAGHDPARADEGSITVPAASIALFKSLRDDGKPAVVFAGHLANWEVLPVIARKFELPTILPYHAPSNLHVAKELLREREALMGRLIPSDRKTPMAIGEAMEKGDHLGMLIDQRLWKGIDVPFFGRPALTNPLAAKFARQFDCPVHGARAIRRPDGGLTLELTPAIAMPRDAEGRIDVAGATATMTAVLEGWIREHPEQYFWLHDRWRR